MIKMIYKGAHHKNVLLEQFGNNQAVESNIYFIMHGEKGIILDPGGQKASNDIIVNLMSLSKVENIEAIFLSHQDPDVVAAINSWLNITTAKALCSDKWQRFIPHFGVEDVNYTRFVGIPDEGMTFNLNGCELLIIPAHFLHSVANFQIYDPISKILYTGDLGASVGAPYNDVNDFQAHIPYMVDFHQRYMLSNTALRMWHKRITSLDIEIIAPQHGAMFNGKDMVNKFIDWSYHLQCGIDLYLDTMYKIPTK